MQLLICRYCQNSLLSVKPTSSLRSWKDRTMSTLYKSLIFLIFLLFFFPIQIDGLFQIELYILAYIGRYVTALWALSMSFWKASVSGGNSCLVHCHVTIPLLAQRGQHTNFLSVSMQVDYHFPHSNI